MIFMNPPVKGETLTPRIENTDTQMAGDPERQLSNKLTSSLG